MPDIVEIAIPVGVRKTFAYSVPPEFRDRISAGMRVLVPFGRKILTGYVVGAADPDQTAGLKLRGVKALLDPAPAIPLELVQTARWVAGYYFAPPGEVFRALFPAGGEISGDRRVSLTDRAAALLAAGFRPEGLHRHAARILEALMGTDGLAVKELSERSAVRGIDPWIESLTTAQLVEVSTPLEDLRVKIKEQLSISAIAADPEAIAKLPSAQKRLYECCAASGELPLQMALQRAAAAHEAARGLERKGLVEIATRQVVRTPEDLSAGASSASLTLTPQQQHVVNQVLELVRQGHPARRLIHGVTGSGKTEIYLRLIAEVVQRGGSAVLLVPEIGLTPLLSRLVVSRFPGNVALLHSGMSSGERFDQWRRIREGGARVVVGTRSAVFAPLRDLRLVVIDEEQDSSYKQDESPCYHAREVAWYRMQQSGGVLLMGSATPSIETFHAATKEWDCGCLSLPERVESKPLPRVSIVDMGEEFRQKGKSTVISAALEQELRGCMERGEQAIILLNRRGYSRALLCRSCGHVFTCPDCSISMTYHRNDDLLACHYCGRENQTPSVCVGCGAPYIHYAGVGTEQLEELLRTLLPEARIARLDRDTTRRRGAMRSTLMSFANQELDVLVGTQMLAKGHDFPAVTMVGVVAADSGLAFPDFRSAERTFQLLTQVAGRAGRGAAPGRVVIQSYYPDHYALQFARTQDYGAFYEREIEFRKLMGYPPFRSLIQILISDPDETKAKSVAEKIATTLKDRSAKIEARTRPHVLGPAAAPIEKLRGSFRVQLLIKFPRGAGGVSLLQECFGELQRHRSSVEKTHVDVDPLSLL